MARAYVRARLMVRRDDEGERKIQCGKGEINHSTKQKPQRTAVEYTIKGKNQKAKIKQGRKGQQQIATAYDS